MASKKLRPGRVKSTSGGSTASGRRTGRTTGMSQSSFAGYGFQGNRPAAETPSGTADEADAGKAEKSPDDPPSCDAEDSGGSSD